MSCHEINFGIDVIQNYQDGVIFTERSTIASSNWHQSYFFLLKKCFIIESFADYDLYVCNAIL